MKRKLYCLAVSVWDADDYLNERNTNPNWTDLYLYATREEAEEKAQSLDVGNDIYNEGFIYEGALTDEEILEITGFEDIADFDEALAEPYSTNPIAKTFGAEEKESVARKILEAPTDEWPTDCANYDFDKSLDGCILVFWSWETYVGYARKCLEIRYAYSDDKKASLTKRDQTFVTQCDVLLTKEEVENADDLKEAVHEALFNGSWKWKNPSFVKSEIEQF